MRRILPFCLSTVSAFAVTVTINTNPSGLLLTVDGVTAASPRIFDWVEESTHTIGAPPVQGNNATRLVLSHWSNGAPLRQTFVTPANATAITANFTRQHRVTVSVNPRNGGTGIGSGWFPEGMPVSIAATPAAGFVFSSFSGGATGSASWVKLPPLAAPVSITANFAIRPAAAGTVYIQSTGTAGSGNGTRGSPFAAPDAHTFDAILRAVPEDREIVLGSGVFRTYGALNGNCQSQGEPGWAMKRRWNLHGAGRTRTIIRLQDICEPPSSGGVYPSRVINVVDTPYYQDASDSILSDLTIDGNYQTFWGTKLFTWKTNLGAATLRGSRCAIRNVNVVNLYAWFTDAQAPGQFNYAESFGLSINRFFSFATNRWEENSGGLIENSDVASSGGNYLTGVTLFSGDGNTQPVPLTEEQAGLPGGVIRSNTVRDLTAGVGAFGLMGRGIVVSGNRATNVRHGIRADTRWLLDITISDNSFRFYNGGLVFSADLDARFRRVVVTGNTFTATNVNPISGVGTAPWVVQMKQSGGNPVEDFWLFNNQFGYVDSGNGLRPSALVFEGSTPGPRQIRMTDSRFDPVYALTGSACGPATEPLCNPANLAQYDGFGNFTTAGNPIPKYNRTLP